MFGFIRNLLVNLLNETFDCRSLFCVHRRIKPLTISEMCHRTLYNICLCCLCGHILEGPWVSMVTHCLLFHRCASRDVPDEDCAVSLRWSSSYRTTSRNRHYTPWASAKSSHQMLPAVTSRDNSQSHPVKWMT